MQDLAAMICHVGVEELNWSAQSTDLNPNEQL